MAHTLNSSVLFVIIVLGAGCGSHRSLADDEPNAMATLRERGAEIDLDDAGHARIVELIDSQATNDDLKLLSKLPHLESCDITGGKKITAEGLVHLGKLKNLQRLYLVNLSLCGQSLAPLAELTKLDVLSLQNTKVDNDGLAHLNKLKALTVLNLAKTKVTNDGLKHLQGLQKLDTLVVKDTAVTGEGFAHLKPLKNLRSLNVDGCRDIDGYLMDLSGLTELRMLYVYGCTVSDEQVTEIENHNPRLAVFGDGNW